jgi:hypothetical protein
MALPDVFQAARGSGKLLACQGACAGICDMFTIHALSLDDDRYNGEGDHQKAQGGGSRNNSNNVQ